MTTKRSSRRGSSHGGIVAPSRGRVAVFIREDRLKTIGAKAPHLVGTDPGVEQARR